VVKGDLKVQTGLRVDGFVFDRFKELCRRERLMVGEAVQGEAAVIALALEGCGENVIVDDGEARIAAEYSELKVYGTLYIILEAYRRNIFKSKAEVMSMVNNMLRKGFYLSSEVYAQLLFLLDKLR